MSAPAVIFFVSAWGAILTSSLAAMVRGGSPERLAATAFLLVMIASWFSLPQHGSAFERFEPGIAVLDLCLLSALLSLAVYARRLWPFIATAVQVVAVLAHAAKLLDPTIAAGAYAQMEGFPIWPISVALVFGTVQHRRRIRIHAVDPSWRPSLPLGVRRMLDRLRLG